MNRKAALQKKWTGPFNIDIRPASRCFLDSVGIYICNAATIAWPMPELLEKQY